MRDIVRGVTMAAALAAIVIGGYLGAGKTTLVNHLLRRAEGRRIAVLVNDFGAIDIDADLIEAQDGDVLSLAGGCICCSFGADLVGMLASVAARRQPPDVVLIEASGVALPGMVARSARLARGIEVEGIVVLADAETLRDRAADRYVGDTVMQQLREADLVLLNKVDLVDSEALAALHGWLQALQLPATLIDVARAEVEPGVVLGLQRDPPAPSAVFGNPSTHAQAADAIFVSCNFELPADVDPQALAARLAQPGQGLVRAKGWGRDAQGQAWQLQVVGRRWSVTPAAVLHDRPGLGRLVVIGLRAEVQLPWTFELASRTSNVSEAQ